MKPVVVITARPEQPVGASKTDDAEWFDYGGAGEIIGVSRRTVYEYVRRGRLKATKLGYRTVRIHRRDIDEFMGRNRKQSDLPQTA